MAKIYEFAHKILLLWSLYMLTGKLLPLVLVGNKIVLEKSLKQ